MARERRGAISSSVNIKTIYYKTRHYIKGVSYADEKNSIKTQDNILRDNI